MKKGITLMVRVYVEGDDDPAHDFTQVGTQVTTQLFQTAFKSFTAPYTFQVLKITPVEGGDDDSSDDSDAAEATPLLQYTPPAGAQSGATPPPQAGPSTGPKRNPDSQG